MFQVRAAAATQFSVLATTQNVPSVIQHPKPFLINVLMKAPLPVWSVSGTVRGASFKILHQCQQFFDLLCNLFYMLTREEQDEYNMSAPELLKDEILFLKQADNISIDLLTGHLKLTNALLTCEEVEKESYGPELIQLLLDEFLFCASKSANLNTSNLVVDTDINIFDHDARKEAFNLLLTLADRCSTNLYEIANQLITRHHKTLNSKLWNVSSKGFLVFLLNLGQNQSMTV